MRTANPDRESLARWLPLLCALLGGPAAAEEPAPGPGAEPVRLTVAAAGDAMLGSDLRRGEKGVPARDGEDILSGFKGVFEAADLAFLNLEGPLADGLAQKKCRPDSRSCYPFRMPTRLTRALTAVGIDVVSNANNHAGDLGPEGMESTIRALDAAGIAHAGRLGDEARLEVKGLRVRLLAAHTGSCCLPVLDIPALVSAVERAAADADIVILSMHAGAEGPGARRTPQGMERAFGEDRGEVRRAARAAVEAGADLVLGHGPHVVRGMEVWKGRLIAYSLGNFVGFRQFGLGGGPTGTSVVLEVELGSDGALLAGRLHPVALDREGVPRPDPRGQGLWDVRALSKLDFPGTGVKVARDGRFSW
jgi:poly-gamma-glutamate capsule biosynthesis protein CapA/YwtB (metallophosphatase superfamily)